MHTYAQRFTCMQRKKLLSRCAGAVAWRCIGGFDVQELADGRMPWERKGGSGNGSGEHRRGGGGEYGARERKLNCLRRSAWRGLVCGVRSGIAARTRETLAPRRTRGISIPAARLEESERPVRLTRRAKRGLCLSPSPVTRAAAAVAVLRRCSPLPPLSPS